MQQYPSIQKNIVSNEAVFAFGKYDGSNIRAEMQKGRFVKFGRRKALLDHSNPILLNSQDIIVQKYEKDIASLLKKKRIDRATCFFEFFGPNSFAGNHDKRDNHDVVFIDMHVYKRGFVTGKELYTWSSIIDSPPVLYRGTVNSDFIRDVKERNIKGMPLEGVVCKGRINPRTKKRVQFKIKTQDWLDALKTFCNGDSTLYEKLA